MDIQQALDIKNALLTLSNALGTPVKSVSSYVCMFDTDKFKILVEASDLWNAFESASFVDRGKMMGIEITEHKPEE